MSRILAIDPGPKASAWCLLDGRKVQTNKEDNEHLLRDLRMNTLEADLFAIECFAGSYGQSVGIEVVETIVFIGRCVEAWEFNQGDWAIRVFRKTAVTHLTNNPKANDSHVRQSLVDRWGGESVALVKERKCPVCKGKGVFGRSECEACAGTKVSNANGPLVGVTKDGWAALSIACYVQDHPNLQGVPV